MLIVIRKNLIKIIILALILISILCAISSIFYQTQKMAFAQKKIIVIDAGHGGRDNGIIGVNGTKEADKNLEIAFAIGEKLEQAGFGVVFTRKDKDGLYNENSVNKKRDDFSARKKILDSVNCFMLISIHCNKYPDGSRRGAQAFYNANSACSKILANIVQENLNGLNSKHVGRTYSALKGDYYMLNCTVAPSVIIESGFLSNEEDEKLLNDTRYIDSFVYAIYCAVVAYCEKI